jgi:hypothetical protein
VKVGEQLREMWRQATGRALGLAPGQTGLEAEAERKTLALPAIASPVQFPGRHLPKPTPVNLRRFAETPLVRRAINVIKDRIAAMDWQVRVRRGGTAMWLFWIGNCARCGGRSKSRTTPTAFAR